MSRPVPRTPSRKSLCLALLLLGGPVSAAPPAVAQSPDAGALMSRHDAARRGRSGEPARSLSLVMKGTCQLAFPGAASDDPMKGTIEMFFDGDDVCSVTDYGKAGVVRIGVDSKSGWETHPVSGVRLFDAVQAAAVRRSLALFHWTAWRDHYDKAEWIGRETIDGRPHVALRLVPGEGEADVWHLDEATSLPSRFETSVPFMEGSVRVQVDLANWTEFAGRPYPVSEKVTAGGVVGVYEYHHVAPGEPVPPERFALPDELFEALGAAGSAGEGASARRFFQIGLRDPQPVASIRAKVPRSDVARAAAEALPEIVAHVTEAGAHTVGGPFCRYHSESGEEVDLEVGIPVTEPIAPSGRIAGSELPGGRVAMTWHLGPYDRLGTVRDELRRWIEERRLAARGGVWEIYWSDPGRDRDPKSWRAQVLCAVE